MDYMSSIQVFLLIKELGYKTKRTMELAGG